MSAELGLWIVLIAGFASVFGSYIFVHKRVGPVMPFLYANARIQARSNFMLSDSDFKTLSELKSLTELISALEKTDYAEEAQKAKNVREFHAAIEKSFIESVSELKKISPEQMGGLLDAYLMFWEAKILKTVYRAKSNKEEVKELESLVLEVGQVDYSLLKHLLETETVADLKVVMAPTVYGKVFEEDYQSLEDFEVALDNFVFDFFAEKVSTTKMHDAKNIVNVLNTKFDIMNLLVFLKAEARGLDKAKLKGLLINNDTILYKLFDKLIAADSLEAAVELCKPLTYYEALKEGLAQFRKDKSLAHFETGLWKHYKKFVIGAELFFPQGPYPLLSYLTKKELEQKNLMIISKGIDLKMPPQQIMELVV